MSKPKMKQVYKNKWFSVLNSNNFFWIQENNSGVISIIESPSQLLFIKTKRPSQNHQEQIESVRGYTESHETTEDSILREVAEETSITTGLSIRELGFVRPNTSIANSRIPVYLVTSPSSFDMRDFTSNEEAHSYVIVDKSEVFNFVIQESVECGLTLSALMLYIADLNN